MMSQCAEWSPLPDFPSRLNELMQACGYSASTLQSALAQVGVQCTAQHLNRLSDGSSDNPSAKLLGGIAVVCEVDVRWFFAQDIREIRALLALRLENIVMTDQRLRRVRSDRGRSRGAAPK